MDRDFDATERLFDDAAATATRNLLAQLREIQSGNDAAPSEPAAVPETGAAGTAMSSTALSRLIVVANRLPITATKNDATGEYTFKMSSGGLVSALVSVRSRLKFVWLGWLGQEIPVEDQPRIREQLLAEFNAIPVFLSEEIAEQYYNGFCNDILWPILHYENAAPFDLGLWSAYKTANRAFADAVCEIAEEGDMIWAHDYHLMVLPLMLRRKLPRATIGWFLHTPFPSSEVFRTLPVRTDLLRCLLACDMVGFHTWDYAGHFLASVSRLLSGATVAPTSVTLRERTTRVGVFPIGIEPDAFVTVARSPACKQRLSELEHTFRGLLTIVSVDRLDPIKGLPHRLLGLDTLFRKHPEWIGRVTLLQVAVPSRVDVETYQRLTSQVAQLIGTINGAFGSLSYSPVVYLYRSISAVELTALYTLGDVALITSLRDGMNLVASEFVACAREPCANRKAPGALVLSEFAGCAQSLAGAIRVNPWSPEDVADGLHTALTLSDAQRRERWEHLHRYVTTFTSQRWALSYVADLQAAGRLRAVHSPSEAGSSPHVTDRARLPRVTSSGIVKVFQEAITSPQCTAAPFPVAIMLLSLDDFLPLLGSMEGEEVDLANAVASSQDTAATSTSTAAVTGAAVAVATVGDGKKAPHTFLKRVLKDICSHPSVLVVAVSSTLSREQMNELFGDIPSLRCVVDGGLLRVPRPMTTTTQQQLYTAGMITPGSGTGASSSAGSVLVAPPTDEQVAAANSLTDSTHVSQRVIAAALEQVDREEAARAFGGDAAATVYAAEDRRMQLNSYTFSAAAQGSSAGGAPRMLLSEIFPRAMSGSGDGAATAAPAAASFQWLSLARGAVGGTPYSPVRFGVRPSESSSALELNTQSLEESEVAAAAASWKDAVRPVLSHFEDQRLRGAEVSETDNSIQFDASGADPDLARWTLKELGLALTSHLSVSPLEVICNERNYSLLVRWASVPLATIIAAALDDFASAARGGGGDGLTEKESTHECRVPFVLTLAANRQGVTCASDALHELSRPGAIAAVEKARLKASGDVDARTFKESHTLCQQTSTATSVQCGRAYNLLLSPTVSSSGGRGEQQQLVRSPRLATGKEGALVIGSLALRGLLLHLSQVARAAAAGSCSSSGAS